ncbi:putative ribonuclease H-like domain-containing protein [Tanacetum coccineum]|uniref:Ribonuclease H-like domain-containing protein n=1 Tax=Tanacetum coccineum TaxID=301880 RepID=A0ABQ5B072_9ASTR
MKGIKREFSIARTPQQNGIAERRNRTLIEAARTMLVNSLLPTTFWAKAEKQTNSTNSFNTVGTPVSTVGPSFTNDHPSSLVNAAEASNAFEDHYLNDFPFINAFALPHVPNVFLIDDTRIFGNAYDDEDVGAEADLNNLETTMNMDVKSAFLYGTIEEEVYVCQPTGFEDPQFSDKVYKVEKALYGLHQARKACKICFCTMRQQAPSMEPNKALVKDEEADSVDVIYGCLPLKPTFHAVEEILVT